MPPRWAIAIIAVAATAAWAQATPDPEAVLKTTRERLLADLDRLPRYTCVQTITRRYYQAPKGGPQSCARLIQEHVKRQNKDELRLLSWDRLRLEVAIAEGQNVFSWVGAARFEAGNLEELAGRGPLGSGDFGTFLESVFGRAVIRFQQEKTTGGRRLLEYSYDVPVERSGYQVKSGAEWVRTAYSGSFLLDPEAADVVSLSVRTAELPGSNPDCQAVSEVAYGRTMIHDRMILIPRETRLATIDRTGSETHSVTAYENCREYASKSRILESAPSDAPPAAKPPPPPVALSHDLRFQCRIVTPIDSDTAAAGDPIEGVLRSPIHDKKNNLLVPAGARLRGRLLLVEHRSAAFNTVRISVQWESIAVNGKEVPLRARPESLNRVNPIYAASGAVFLGAQTFVFSADHLHLQHFDWTWVTQAYNIKGENASGSPALLRTVEIADSEFPIAAAGGVHLQFSVPAGVSGVRLEGTVSVSGGAKDIAVLLFTSEEFAKMQNQEPAAALYESGRTGQAAVYVPLPSDAATYYLVLSNDFPLSTPKVVRASLRLLYMR